MLVIGLAAWLGLNVMIPIAIELATRLDRHVGRHLRNPAPESSLPFEAGSRPSSHW
jgi:hypothetical protein